MLEAIPIKVGTFIDKHNNLIEEIGEHQPMLDLLLEAIPQLRQPDTCPTAMDDLTEHIHRLMDEWNELTRAVNERLLVALQLQAVLVPLSRRDVGSQSLADGALTEQNVSVSVQLLRKTLEDISADVLDTVSLTKFLSALPTAPTAETSSEVMKPSRAQEPARALSPVSVDKFLSSLVSVCDKLPVMSDNVRSANGDALTSHHLSETMNTLLNDMRTASDVHRELDLLLQDGQIINVSNASPDHQHQTRSSLTSIQNEAKRELTRLFDQVHLHQAAVAQAASEGQSAVVKDGEKEGRRYSESIVMVEHQLRKFKAQVHAFVDHYALQLLELVPTMADNLVSSYTRVCLSSQSPAEAEPTKSILEEGPSSDEDNNAGFLAPVKPEFLSLEHGDIHARVGQLLVVDCRLAGRPTPMIRWSCNQTNGQSSLLKVINSGNRSVLTIRVTEADQGAALSCTASNEAGSATWGARLYVSPFPVGLLGPQSAESVPSRSAVQTAVEIKTKTTNQMNTAQKMVSAQSPPVIGRYTIMTHQEENLGKSKFH